MEAQKAKEVEIVIAERDCGFIRNTENLPDMPRHFLGSLTLEAYIWILCTLNCHRCLDLY
jgi:hypothetical protein